MILVNKKHVYILASIQTNQLQVGHRSIYKYLYVENKFHSI